MHTIGQLTAQLTLCCGLARATVCVLSYRVSRLPTLAARWSLGLGSGVIGSRTCAPGRGGGAMVLRPPCHFVGRAWHRSFDRARRGNVAPLKVAGEHVVQ